MFWPYTICRPNTNTKINRTSTHTRSVFFFLHVAIRNSLRSNKNEHVRSDPPTHHDIVKQYRKGLAAVVDRCVNISYNRYHSVAKSFICCCSGRDSCRLTSRCMLPWLRSAPYPALCSCDPLRPVDDVQTVSYGARSRQYSPLLPVSSSQPRSIVE